MATRFFSYIIANPIRVIIGCLIVTVGMGYFFKDLTIDPSVEAMMFEDDPVRVELERLQNDFGNDDRAMIAFSVKNAFDRNTLAMLHTLTERLQEVPGVSEVTSLTNVDRIVGKGDSLIVGDFLTPIPTSERVLAERKAEALANPVYVGDLINKDLSATMLLVRVERRREDFKPDKTGTDDVVDGFEVDVDEPEEKETSLLRIKIYDEIERVTYATAKEHSLSRDNVYFTGFFAVKSNMNRYIKRDNRLFIPLTVVMLLIFLYVSFRNLRFIWLPLAVLGMTTVSTLGLMAAVDINIDVITSFLTIVLMVISVADVVHILMRYFEELAAGAPKDTALVSSLNSVLRPCFLTSVTTLFGFLSLLYTDIAPIRNFGVFAGIGVSLAFAYSVVFVPAVLSLLKPPDTSNLGKVNSRLMDSFLGFLADMNEKYRWPIMAVTLVLVVFSISGIFLVNVETVYRNIFGESAVIVKHTDFVDEKLGGAQTLDVTIEALCHDGENFEKHRREDHLAKVSDQIKEISVLREIEGLQEFLKSEKRVRKTVSLVDTIKELNKSMNAEDPAFYRLPDSTAKASNLLFLYDTSADSDSLKELSDRDYTRTRISIRLQDVGSNELGRIIGRIRAFNDSHFSKNLRVAVNGNGVIFAAMAQTMLTNILTGITLAITLIIIIMGLIFRSVKIGLLSILPNVVPIALNFFVMYILSIDVNMSNAMIASIAIGLVVDDTIHFFSRFISEMRKDNDHEKAVRRTLMSTGRALAYTTLILGGGFFITVVSNFGSTREFGLLMTTVVAFALFADLVLTSVVILVTKPRLKISPE